MVIYGQASQLNHRHHHLHLHCHQPLSSSSSFLSSSYSRISSHMAQHHPRAWLWQPPASLHHHCQRVYRRQRDAGLGEREHMFEKPLTPSDVGKLNRLVIPKQHAEKYFPLDGDSGEKGLLLSFEDESGKPWQFRYSYWTSSQSYVLTKGWSRFVKEKRLDAGDVVLFERPRFGCGDRLFIGCRHRGSASESPPPPPQAASAPAQWSGTTYYAAAPCPLPTSGGSCFSPVQRADSSLHGGSPRDEAEEQRETAAPSNSKRLRLFGVNLDCWQEPDPRPVASTSSWFLG